MNEEIKEKTVILPPFKHFIMTVGAIPTSYLESMTYYEMLVWFTNYLGKTIIPAINENGEAVTELQNLFRELQYFVNNYFDNLDVQEEVNQKLDEMASDGTLENLINTSLNLLISKKSYNNFNFGTCPWISGTTESKKREYIDTLYNLNLNTFELYVYIVNTDGVFSIRETDEEILYLLEYAKSKNIYPSILKFHQTGITTGNFDEDFVDKYMEQVNHVINLTKNYGYNYVTVLNEFGAIYTLPQYETYALQIINQIKQQGFMVSISVAGINPDYTTGALQYMTDNLKNAIDFFAINGYFKGMKTITPISSKQNYNAMKNELNYNIDYLIQECNKYNKKVIITETGLSDYWNALCSPASYEFNTQSVSNGKAPNVYFVSLMWLLHKVQDYIIGVYWWFGTLSSYQELQKNIIKYLGGNYE